MSKKVRLKHAIKSDPYSTGIIIGSNISQLPLNELNRLSADMILFWDFIYKGSSFDDRSFAIMMTAYIDNLLSAALEKTFLELEDSIQNDLFSSNGGALSTLYNKSLVAYALGLIDADVLETTRRIRKVRNAFAHSLANIDFNHPAISNVCMAFRVDELSEQAEQHLLQFGYNKSTSRGRFFFGCRSVFGHLFSYTSAFGDFFVGPTRFRAKRFSRDELTSTKTGASHQTGKDVH